MIFLRLVTVDETWAHYNEPVSEIAVHLAVAGDVFDGVFL